MSGKRRRDLSDTEHAEWAAFTKKIEPLSAKARAAVKKPADGTASSATKASEKPAKPPQKPVAKPDPKPAPAPPLVPLGRREKSRVARGRDEIEARIDLHGYYQDEAHAALLRFVRHAASSGKRMVLVITGKSGVLRRQVPLWLALPDLRPLIVGVTPAALRHGGEGALYVRLRRARD